MMAKGIKSNDDYSAIVESNLSNSYMEKEDLAYMATTFEELARRFEEKP